MTLLRLLGSAQNFDLCILLLALVAVMIQIAIEHGMGLSMPNPPILYAQQHTNTKDIMEAALKQASAKSSQPRERPGFVLCIKGANARLKEFILLEQTIGHSQRLAIA